MTDPNSQMIREITLFKAAYDSLTHALQNLNLFSRFFYVGMLRNESDNQYYHLELEHHFGRDFCNLACSSLHSDLFRDLTKLSLDVLEEQMQAFLNNYSNNGKELLANWSRYPCFLYRLAPPFADLLPSDNDYQTYRAKIDMALCTLCEKFPLSV